MPQLARPQIYAGLGLEGYEERVRPRVERAAADQRGYKTNTFSPLQPAVRDLLARRWGKYASAWGYSWG